MWQDFSDKLQNNKNKISVITERIVHPYKKISAKLTFSQKQFVVTILEIDLVEVNLIKRFKLSRRVK